MCPTDIEVPQYVGGQPVPADHWGTAPLRGQIVQAVETFLTHKAIAREPWGAGDLVDDLVLKGLIPDEHG